ncbi:VOC family protein [Cerasicoccus frondis]|uniref:VOC family protein n=1 Tax=Cerasicoccus frondis TaxID=490090 RepID=UPI0028524FCB|nr:hypothetical protein [Cerasicoccus frondis]
MKSGLVIYSAQLDKLMRFYGEVFGLELKEHDRGYALLEDDDFELVILETETARSLGVNSEGIPSPRDATAIKPAFFISTSLADISAQVKAYGGGLHAPKDWTFGGRWVCDAWDCEGNIFQLRGEL